MRLIDADALTKIGMIRMVSLSDIYNSPTVDAVAVVAEWIQPLNEHFRTCSNCNISMGLVEGEKLDRFKYCPFCGAKMRGEPSA